MEEAVMFERISPYDDVFEQFRRFEREFDELWGGGTGWGGNRNIRAFSSGAFPGVNVAATNDGITIYLFAPGIDPKTLDTSIQQNALLISGKREIPQQKDGTYYRQERFSGAFRRVVSLPDDVDPDRVEARYKDGIVHITIGRQPAAKPRQIEIH
jgi:HSP20 family protein